jgi:hypothetical protein
MEGHLFFHSPCFDGICSAVLMVDYLRHQGWEPINLRAANYGLRPTWLTTPLPSKCAVVDFLYHPAALYWADHHATTFLDESSHAAFTARHRDPNLVFDPQAKSCAGLLSRHLSAAWEYRNSQFDELVCWAEKIDAAQYNSVDEVFNAPSPALRINASLVAPSDCDAPECAALDRDAYCVRLVNDLLLHTLAEVANAPAVRELADRSLKRQLEARDRREDDFKVTSDGIILFDFDDEGGVFNRYTPYHFHRDARYSIGILRNRGGAKITAMRNPWREFPCAPLGNLCQPLGGGHQRVGSIMLKGELAKKAKDEGERLLNEIRAFHARPL